MAWMDLTNGASVWVCDKKWHTKIYTILSVVPGYCYGSDDIHLKCFIYYLHGFLFLSFPPFISSLWLSWSFLPFFFLFLFIFIFIIVYFNLSCFQKHMFFVLTTESLQPFLCGFQKQARNTATINLQIRLSLSTLSHINVQ